jgi:hypothetical protein
VTSYPKALTETVEAICGTIGGQVFYRDDDEYPEAIILMDDKTYMVRVAFDGSTSDAYASTTPLEDIVRDDIYSVADLPELEGWSTGWSC